MTEAERRELRKLIDAKVRESNPSRRNVGPYALKKAQKEKAK